MATGVPTKATMESYNLLTPLKLIGLKWCDSAEGGSDNHKVLPNVSFIYINKFASHYTKYMSRYRTAEQRQLFHYDILLRLFAI